MARRRKAKKNFFFGGKKAKAPAVETWSVSYEVWKDRMPRRGSKKFTAEELAGWYHTTLADPTVDGVRIKSASGPGGLKRVAEILGVSQTALNNPTRALLVGGGDAVAVGAAVELVGDRVALFDDDLHLRAHELANGEFHSIKGYFLEEGGRRPTRQEEALYEGLVKKYTALLKKFPPHAQRNPREVAWTRAFNNPDTDRYQIRSDWPEELWQWGPQPRLAQWTGYPQYSYEQFYRENPRRKRSHRTTRIYFWGPSYEESNVFLSDNRRGWEAAYDQLVRTTGKDATGFIEVSDQMRAAANPSDAAARAVPWEVADNAGWPSGFQPDIFPFGQGGRPAEYAFPKGKKNPKRKRKKRGEGDAEIITCRGVFGPHMIRRGDLFGQVEGDLVCLRCYNESLPDLPQYGKANPQYRMGAAQMRQKIAQLDELYQYGQIDDETYHRLRSEMVVEPSARHGETIGSKLRGLEERVGDRLFMEKYYPGLAPRKPSWRQTKYLLLQARKGSDHSPAQKWMMERGKLRLGAEFGVPFPTAILPRHLEAAREEISWWKNQPAPEVRPEAERRVAQYNAYAEVLSDMGATQENIKKFLDATRRALHLSAVRKDFWEARATGDTGRAARLLKKSRDLAGGALHPWSIFGPSGPQMKNIPSWARHTGIKVEERDARRAAKAKQIRSKKALRKPPKITGPHRKEIERLRAEQLREQAEGWVPAEPEIHWRSQSMQEREDPFASFMYPEGAEAHFRSGLHPKAMDNRGRRGRKKAKKNRSYVGSGARGGFVGGERDSLPNWYFLKPSTRGWPAGDPRKGARDDMHAEEVIKYMNRGFGNRSDYPQLIAKLAERYPVEDVANREIWTLYRQYRDAIDEKMSDRGVRREMPTVAELRKREVAVANRRRSRKRRKR